jgi:3-deoxy-D-manno-octulosonic-acid transferase
MKLQKKLFELGKSNVAVSGDTRFDSGGNFRKDNSLEYISQFKDNTLTIVVGSS